MQLDGLSKKKLGKGLFPYRLQMARPVGKLFYVSTDEVGATRLCQSDYEVVNKRFLLDSRLEGSTIQIRLRLFRFSQSDLVCGREMIFSDESSARGWAWFHPRAHS